MKVFSKIIVLVITALLLFQQAVFAATYGDPVNVKVRGEFEVGNESSGSLNANITAVLANDENAEYSILLDERASNQISNVKYVDDKHNRTGETQLNNIPKNNSGIFNYEYLVQLRTVDYQLVPENVITNYTYDPSLQIYLQPSANIESNNPTIIAKANELVNSLSAEERQNPYYIIEVVYDFVVNNMYYTFDDRARNKGAVFALANLVGNCEDYSSLMVALLRASNIPARTVTGFKVKVNSLSTSEINLLSSTNYTRHMWVEVYVPGYGWVAFDPTVSTATIVSYKVKTLNVNVQAYKPLSVQYRDTFGKLNDLYIKERYDYTDGVNKATVSRSPAWFEENWFAQIVDYDAFATLESIEIIGDLQYSESSQQLFVLGYFSDAKTRNINATKVNWTTSDSTIAYVVNGELFFTGKSGSVVINAEYQGKFASKTVEVNNIVLQGIKINEELVYSETPVQLTVTGMFSDNTNQLLSDVIWTSDNPLVATVHNGLVTFTGIEGQVTITAFYQGFTDSVSAIVEFENVVTLENIYINEMLAYSETPVQLTLTGVLSDNSTQPLFGATWWSSNPDVATVDNGLVMFTGVEGIVTITAMYQDKSTSVTVMVDLPDEIVLEEIFINETLSYSESPAQLTVSGRFSDNSIQPIIGAMWTSDNPLVATVNNGLVTFTGADGFVTITATYQGKSASVSANVDLPDPVLVSIVINEELSYSETPVQLSVDGIYSDNSRFPIYNATWTTSDPNVAMVSENGVVTFTGNAGNVTITAIYEGFMASVFATVQEQMPVLLNIAINESLTYSETPVQLTVTGYYSNNQVTPIHGATWMTSDANIATVDENGIVTFTGNAGSVTITAFYEGLMASAFATVQGQMPLLSHIVINETLAYSETPVQLTVTGYYSNNDVVPIYGATWTSSNEDVATVYNGLVTFTGNNGEVIIQALFEGKTASVVAVVNRQQIVEENQPEQEEQSGQEEQQVEENQPEQEEQSGQEEQQVEENQPEQEEQSEQEEQQVEEPTIIALNFQNDLVYDPNGVQLFVQATYSNDAVATVNDLVVWETSDPSIATVSDYGFVEFTGKEGFVEIRAIYNGLVATTFSDIQIVKLTGIYIDGKHVYYGRKPQLKVIGVYSDNEEKEITNVQWSTSNSNIATVDSNGVVYFYLANRTVEIIAVVDGFEARLATYYYVSYDDDDDDNYRRDEKEEDNGDDEASEGNNEDDTDVADNQNEQNVNPSSVFKTDVVEYNKVYDYIKNIQQHANTVANFKDTQNHWAKDMIALARTLNITNGYVDNTFKPNNTITRQEFVSMLARVLRIEPSNNPTNLKDISNSFAKGHIIALQEKGIINGYGDNTFKPNAPITRAEIAVILNRILNEIDENAQIPNFNDIKGHWGKAAIDRLAKAGVIKGTGGNTFSPDKHTTRAEAIVMLIRFLELDEEIKSLIEQMK